MKTFMKKFDLSQPKNRAGAQALAQICAWVLIIGTALALLGWLGGAQTTRVEGYYLHRGGN